MSKSQRYRQASVVLGVDLEELIKKLDVPDNHPMNDSNNGGGG